MNEDDVRRRAFAMPLTSPAFPQGPYRFIDREYMIITYRTDRDALDKIVPAPLCIEEPLVKYEFIRMPDSTGFGHYVESVQSVPVTFKGQAGLYTHAMYLDNGPAIASGREIWGFPKKLARPSLVVESDALVGALHYGANCVAQAIMGYKHRALDATEITHGFARPNFLLKIIPDVDGSPRILELVDYRLKDVFVKSAWSGPASLELHAHAFAPVSDLPVREIVEAVHILTDLTLGLGEVVHDYQ